MNAAQEMIAETYEESFKTPPSEIREPVPFLAAIRRCAREKFQALGFPTRKAEAWKYINLSPILKSRFVLASQKDAEVDLNLVRGLAASEEESRLAFVNGFYSERLSSPQALPPGVILQDLKSALAQYPAQIEKYLAANLQDEANPFAVINAFSFDQGIFLYLPRETTAVWPIHFLFLGSGSGALPEVFYPRILVVLEEGARAEILFDHYGANDQPYFMNAAVEIFLGARAKLSWTALQRRSENAFQFLVSRCALKSGASLEAISFTDGGQKTRNEISVALDGEDASCAISGLSVLSEAAAVYDHVTVEHRVPRGTSRQIFKNILSGQSQTEFDSLVHVHRGAAQSDSHQLNRNLLLSENARAYSRPHLRIYTDDVKASHGAANGQLEKDELFYLRSRGLSRELARLVLAYGFAEEILEKVRPEAIRRRLEDSVREKLQAMIRQSSIGTIV